MKLFTVRAKFSLSLALGVSLLGLAILACSVGLSPDDLRLTVAQPPIEFSEEGEGPRSNWFYAQRAYPLKTIPYLARMHAIEQLELEEARLKARHAAIYGEADPAQSLTWVPLGPAPIGQGQTFGTPRVAVSGRISTVVFDPGYNGTSNQTVYLGAALGGVWRSRDNGATWAPITDDQPSLAMGAIAIDPTNPNIIYAGTGEAHLSGDSYYGAGLLKSTDGGATWMQITGPISASDPRQPAFLNAAFHALVIDPTTPSTLYAATTIGLVSSASGATVFPPLGDRGIWKSTDGGMTWRNLNPPNLSVLRQSGTDVLFDPRDPRRVFAAILEFGIYRSIAGGEPGTWEKLTAGLPDADLDRIKLAVGPPLAPSTSATLYAAISRASNTRLLGVFKSTDGGTTWAQTTTPSPTTGGTFYSLALAVDPVDANVVYYGTLVNATNTGGTFWRSRDGGQTWVDLSLGNGASGGLHADTHWIAVNPANRDILFTANDGGVWRTENATADVIAWTSLNQSLNITQFYTIALHPTAPNLLLGGTQDNGTDRYDGNLNWFHSRGGDGGAVLIDQSNPQVMYHTFINRNNAGGASAVIGPEISFNGGNTWPNRRGCFGCATQMGNFNPSDRLSDYAPMAQHTGFTGAQGNVIYFGTHRLYRSADQGVTWTGLGASADGFGADLTKNIPDPQYGNGFPSYISAIAAHPALDQNTNPPGETVWVGTGDGLVHLTTNAGSLAGTTFTNVTKAPLPNRYVTDIALDPNDKQRAVVAYSGFNTNTPATPGHVFTTNDQGATWRDLSGNLPDIPVNSVVIDPLLAGAIYVGTDLGVFQTTDGGATWIRLSNGAPKVAVFTLRYHAATRSLIAATHGRGVYRLNLPAAVASVSAASFAPALAGESIVAAFGNGLATVTQAATSLPLPTELAGTRVVVRDSAGVERLAPLFFVAPSQVNYQMPPGAANGLATVTIRSGDGTTSTGSSQINSVAPGLFAANANGRDVAAAVAVRVKADGSQSFEPVAMFDQAQNRFVPVPIDLGPPSDTVVLVLFGTGIRNRSAQSAVNVKLGGVDALVQYASGAPGFVGLDQVNAIAPRALAGRGEIDVALTADGKAANMVRIAFR
jgi:uncharacterized protein (TIGR03437 family)